MGDVILEDNMHLCSSKDYTGIECRVSLSPSALLITPLKEQYATKAKALKLEDVIGCLCMKHQQTTEADVHTSHNIRQNLASVFLNVYSYYLSKTLRSHIRKRDSVLLRYGKHSSFADNSTEAAR